MTVTQQFNDEFQALSAEFPIRDSAFFVALSGGLDSCVLLDVLAFQTEQNPEMQVGVLHYDHGLQEDSTQWATFCAERCAEYEFEFFTNELDVKLTNKSAVDVDKKIGIEASARKARYQWFEETMWQALQDKPELKNIILLTAHHCDDQAETMLLNILRGTGLKGLRGIATKKNMSENSAGQQCVLLRPLLNFTQQEIQHYAEAQKLKWIEDPSNRQTIFRRNAIRHNVMPALKKIKPDASKQFSRLSHRIADAEHILHELALSDLSLSGQYGFSPFDHSYGLGFEGLRVFSVSRQLNAIRYWLDLIQYPAESEMDLLKVLDWSHNGANSGAELRRGGRCYRYFQDTLYVMPYVDEAEGIYVTEYIDKHENGNIIWQDSSHPLSLDEYFVGDLKWQLCCIKESKYYGQRLQLKTSNNTDSIYLANGEGHIQAKNCFQAAKVPPWCRRQALFVTQTDGKFVAVLGGQMHADFYLELVENP